MNDGRFWMAGGFLLASTLCIAPSRAVELGSNDAGRPVPPVVVTPQPQPKPEPVKPIDKGDDGCGCGDQGTAIQFVDTPSHAAKRALRQQKLVLVLHVSGIFEDPKLT